MKIPQNSAPEQEDATGQRPAAGRCRARARRKTKTPTAIAIDRIDDADHEKRQHFAEHHLGRPQRRREQLLHRAHFPLARDGQRGQQRRDDHEDDGDQSRHDVVLGFERAVVPDAQARIDRWHRRARRRCGSAPATAVRAQYVAHQRFRIAQSDRRRIGIAAVDQHLHFGTFAAAADQLASNPRGITTPIRISARSIACSIGR